MSAFTLETIELKGANGLIKKIRNAKTKPLRLIDSGTEVGFVLSPEEYNEFKRQTAHTDLRNSALETRKTAHQENKPLKGDVLLKSFRERFSEFPDRVNIPEMSQELVGEPKVDFSSFK